MSRSATLSVALAQQIKDLLPTMQVLGPEMDTFFKSLANALDDTITEVTTTNRSSSFTVKISAD